MSWLIDTQSGAETATKKWGTNSTIARQWIEARSIDQSAQSTEIFFAFYQDGLSWHLRALHYKLATTRLPGSMLQRDVELATIHR